MPRLLRSRVLLATLVAAGVASLPFAHGLLLGHALFFRDLSGQFFPLRRFVVEGLLQGELRFWNPYLHEGEPLTLLPIGYPLDLLQALVPNEWGLSLVLALHVPLGAVLFMRLAQALGRGPAAAAGGALVYALGGFCLSTVNLYVYVEAMAWAPLLALTLLRAADGGRRELAWAALATALALSTTGLEIVAQAVLLGLVLGLSRGRWRRAGAPLAGLTLGLALSAPLLLFLGGLARSGERGLGFHANVVTAHSIHPFTFLQALVGDLYGELPNLVNHWWGVRFFPLGFPYILSLYLGAAALVLAVAGLADRSLPRRPLLLLGAVAGWVCLGRFAGLDAVVELSPWLRMLRFPTKAYFTLHTLVALLVASGLQLLAAAPRPWRLAAAAGLALGLPLAAVPWLPALLPAQVAWFRGHFFPPGWPEPARARALADLLQDARVGGLLALAVAGLAALVLSRRLRPAAGAALAAAVVAADLLRAGMGLNPMVSPAFYQGSSELQAISQRLRASGARLFTCEPESARAYFEARALRPEHDWWTFAAFMEAQVPYFNMNERLPTALTIDRTMLVPVERVLAPEEAACGAVPQVLQRLRAAGVSHVLSLSPLEHADLERVASWSPQRLAPLVLHLYALRAPLPLRFVAVDARPAARDERAGGADGATLVEGLPFEARGARGQLLADSESSDEIRLAVRSDRPTVVVVRDAFAPGWSASLDGQPVPLLRADGRHRAVAIPAGDSQVRLRYRPPGVRAGLALSGLALLAVALLLRPAPTART